MIATTRMGNLNYIKFILVLAVLFSACSTSGPVTTEQIDSQQPVVEAPKEFISNLEKLNLAQIKSEELLDSIPIPASFASKNWIRLASWLQEYDTLSAEQEEVEAELEATGQIELEPGRSYSFDLESFCVHPGNARPVKGDGLKVAPVKGPAAKWLPEILKNYSKIGIQQSEAQTLIWALLEGSRFDQLSVVNQRNLKRIFPDAATRFGNKIIEDLAKNYLTSMLPGSTQNVLSDVQDLREKFWQFQDDFKELERVFVPKSTRNRPIPVGWLKMDEGYFLKITSYSYSKAHVDIFVPKDLRSPQSLSKITFSPTAWIGLPEEGQRLALSTKAKVRGKIKTDNICKQLRRFKAKNCHVPTDNDREKIVEAADPKNFPQTRYASPPAKGAPIQQETDCSHFTQEIYRRAGLEFPYTPTSLMGCLSNFEEIAQENLQAGDLVLFKGHIGIMTKDGKVISATKGGERGYARRSITDPLFKSSISIKNKDNFKEFSKGLRWRCP